MAILYGVGRPQLTTELSGQERLLTFEPMSFQLNTDTNVVKSTKFNTEGQIVDAGSARQAIRSTLTMTVEAITWFSMQLAFGELAATGTDLVIPDLRFGKLPATGAQEISDADIPATANLVSAAVYDDEEAKSLVRVSGVPAAGQFAVAAGKITVGPGLAGKTIGYRILETIPTCESIGVDPNATLFTKLSFAGVLSMDGVNYTHKIVVPQLSQDKDPSIAIEAPTKFNLEYTLITEPGKRRPFFLYRIPNA